MLLCTISPFLLTDCAGNEESQVEPVRQLQYVVQPFDVDFQCKWNVLFTNCTQEGTEVHNCADALIYNDLPQIVVVEDVSVEKRS